MTFVLSVTLGACSAESDLHVVARGRYVELVTDRDLPICGGTVEFYDRFIEEGFAFIGETPPDHLFVRYEWTGPERDPETGLPGDIGVVRTEGDHILVRINQLVHEHELAHAIHQEAWPPSAPFLHEGFAELLDPRRGRDNFSGLGGATLDEVLEAERTAEDAIKLYQGGWFLVSQIVADHGTSGLRDFWHAVPPGAGAQEIREAYQSLFGRPIDALVEPWVYENDDPELDGAQTERFPCYFALCTGKPVPWEDDEWSVVGPHDCEDDPDAIGPYESNFGLIGPPVWRDYVLDRDGPYFEPRLETDPGAVTTAACSLDCLQPTAYDYGQGPAPDEPWRQNDLVRVQVHSKFEDLPTDTPIEARFARTPL